MMNLMRLIVLLLGVIIIEIKEVASVSDDSQLSALIDAADTIERIKSLVGLEEDIDALEIRRMIEDHGLNADEVLADRDFWSSLLDGALWNKGDGTRWATLNFVYQLACYQGKTGSMISKALWVWKTYNQYGCYCGGGDYYGNYVDSTDHCCQTHDFCYERVQKKYKLELGCHTYTTKYNVSCCSGKRKTKCADSGPSAGRELCECDQAMSQCVAQSKAKSTYNKKYYNNRRPCNDKAGKYVKAMTLFEILKSCKHYYKAPVTFKKTYGSQGSCPATKKKPGWWFGKKDQE